MRVSPSEIHLPRPVTQMYTTELEIDGSFSLRRLGIEDELRWRVK